MDGWTEELTLIGEELEETSLLVRQLVCSENELKQANIGFMRRTLAETRAFRTEYSSQFRTHLKGYQKKLQEYIETNAELLKSVVNRLLGFSTKDLL